MLYIRRAFFIVKVPHHNPHPLPLDNNNTCKFHEPNPCPTRGKQQQYLRGFTISHIFTITRVSHLHQRTSYETTHTVHRRRFQRFFCSQKKKNSHNASLPRFASGHCEFYVITLGCQRTTPMVNVSRLRWAPSLPLTTTHLCCVVQVQRSVYCNHFKPWLCCCFGLPNVEIFLLFYLLGCSKYFGW